MLDRLLTLAKQYFGIKQQVEKNAADIRDLQQQMKELTVAVQHVANEVRHNHDNEAHERENLLLRLENTLLRFERRLPPGDPGSRLIDP